MLNCEDDSGHREHHVVGSLVHLDPVAILTGLDEWSVVVDNDPHRLSRDALGCGHQALSLSVDLLHSAAAIVHNGRHRRNNITRLRVEDAPSLAWPHHAALAVEGSSDRRTVVLGPPPVDHARARQRTHSCDRSVSSGLPRPDPCSTMSKSLPAPRPSSSSASCRSTLARSRRSLATAGPLLLRSWVLMTLPIMLSLVAMISRASAAARFQWVSSSRRL